MTEYQFKINQFNSTINKYLENNNYENDFSELYEHSPKTDDSEKNKELWRKDFEEFRRKKRNAEKTHPRYSTREDISTLEFLDYSKGKDDDPSEHQFLEVTRNLISEVELNDLKEIMILLDDRITEEVENDYGDSDILELKKCMKSIARIVHRFEHSHNQFLPIEETNQSRDANTVW